MTKDQAKTVGDTLLEPVRQRQSEVIRKREARRLGVLQHGRRVAWTFLGTLVGGSLGYWAGGAFLPAGLLGASIGSIVGVVLTFIRQTKDA